MPKKPQSSEPATKADVSVLKTDVRTIKTDIKKLDGKLDKLQNTLDGFIGRVDDLTIENRVGTNQISELHEQVESHEKRIAKLESHNNN